MGDLLIAPRIEPDTVDVARYMLRPGCRRWRLPALWSNETGSCETTPWLSGPKNDATSVRSDASFSSESAVLESNLSAVLSGPTQSDVTESVLPAEIADQNLQLRLEK